MKVVTGVAAAAMLIGACSSAGKQVQESAGAVTEALDQAGWGEIMGTIAGDDTVLVITRSQKLREAIASRIRGLVRK